MSSLLLRATLAALLAIAIAGIARKRRLLARSGAVAAVVLGTGLVTLGGWWSGLLIVAFFLSSSLLSGTSRATTIEQARGDERDAVQVAANGAVALACALSYAMSDNALWLAALLGSIAGATSDTWSTEIGRSSTLPPRLITTLHPVPRGTSGAISAKGTAGALCGGLVIGAVGAVGVWLDLFPIPGNSGRLILIGGAAGLAGSLFDSLLGATAQERRSCPVCGRPTESRVHSCGSVTDHVAGIPGFTNDIVNFLCVILGAVVCTMLV